MKKSRVYPWKDPRLAIGVLLIAGGGLVGSILLGGESSVPLLRAAAPIAQGSVLTESQFVVAELPARLGEDYLRSGQIPDGAVAAHTIGAGELLSSSAVGTRQGWVDLAIPLLIEPASSVPTGSKVDLWRVKSAGMNASAQARIITRGAILVSVNPHERTAKASAQVRVEPADVPAVLEALGTQDGIVIAGEAGR